MPRKKHSELVITRTKSNNKFPATFAKLAVNSQKPLIRLSPSLFHSTKHVTRDAVASSLRESLSKHTSFFGIRLWILIVTLIALFLLIILILVSFYLLIFYHRRRQSYKTRSRLSKIPITQKRNQRMGFRISSVDRGLLPGNMSDIEMNLSKPEFQLLFSDRCMTRGATVTEETNLRDLESGVVYDTWRRGDRFSLKEIEVATYGFAAESVIARGDNAVVYRGVLLDNTRVAVKRLLSESINQAEAEDFIREVENFGHIKHKNLVNLHG